MRQILAITVLLFPLFLSGQDILQENKSSYKKADRVYKTQRIEGHIKIDGVLDDAAWQTVEPTGDFITFEPVPGLPASQPTEVRIVYDDEAIYIGAYMHDVARDSIYRELTERDETGNADYFGIVFDSYRDNINGFWFMVTSAGTQVDVKTTTFGEDGSWNAVWYSETTITDSGWVAEFKIPYSALRFPKTPVQEWNINMIREIRRLRQTAFWNELDPTVDGILTQSGQLTGIRDINPPLRLSFTPYLAFSLQNNSSKDIEVNNNFNWSGGMDIRYGINDAFTLDLTLIPDFSQAQSDNLVLNLSQFEVRYDENRQFFTEGTELFEKADLIYWRRVGGTPLLHSSVYDSLESGDVLKENPENQQLLNAFKISGRNAKGLGIGVFNGITNNMYAEIENPETGNRKILTDPLTNYNVLVFDQNLKNNSYVSLINTNVSRSRNFYNANVLGTQFKILDKTNTWGIEGSGSWNKKYGSSVIDPGLSDGYTYNIGLGKVSGNLTFGVYNEIISDKYDRNDFGFLTINDIISTEAYISYDIFEPFGNYNKGGFSFSIENLAIYSTGSFADFSFGFRTFLITKKFNAFGASARLEPVRNHDYWEPRVDGRFFLEPENYRMNVWYSSDYSKRFAFDVRLGYRFYNSDQSGWRIGVSPRFRVNNKLAFVLSISDSKGNNDIGFVDILDDDSIILGKRDRSTLETVLNMKYTFTNKMNLNFRLRHYWAKVKYKDFYSLNDDGTLGYTDYNGLDEDGNQFNNLNFNVFNIDMVYRWVFLPGSELDFIWKNLIMNNNVNIDDSYFENLATTLALDQINTFTIKALYYLDFLVIQKALKHRKTTQKS